MSRLIDVLTRMDEERAPRPSLGGLPHLGESAEPRQWRILGTLVIVVGMGALALTLWLRPPPVVRPAVKPPRALAVSTPVSTPATSITSSRERAATLIQSGLAAARQGEIDAAALRAMPGYPEAHRNLAVALDRQGRTSEAARHYRAFLARSAADNPDRASIVARLDEMGRGRVAE